MKRIVSLFLLLVLIFSICPTVFAEDTVTKIYTVEDLKKIAENPAGSYILMADLDMTGIEWTPVDLLGGTFDGNGHSILNLTITRTGNMLDVSYDGNGNPYDTYFAGLFGVMRDASVVNLNLINVRVNVKEEEPCFIGSIAGAMYDSEITNCTVSGTLELQAYDRMFGVGGLVGYGSGKMERCTADVTLICIDTEKDTVDEQFLGGAYATGFIDVIDCTINIDGYVSEYGYVHSGGIIGMLLQEPLGTDRKGYLTGNTVNGKITFFESSAKRCAFCKSYVGEIIASDYVRTDNVANFKRDEKWKFDVILRPEMCENPVYTEVVTAADCENFGYITYTCEDCGYSYTDHYTLPQHSVTQWTVTQEPTVEEYGVNTGFCDSCGMEFTKEVPKLEPIQPETLPIQPTQTVEHETKPVEQIPEENTSRQLSAEMIWIPIVLIVLLLIGIVLRFVQSRFE